MTWDRTLKKALVRCGQSPDFAVWSKVAADRGEWRKLWGQNTPLSRQKPTAYAEQVLDIFYGPGPPPPDAPPPIASQVKNYSPVYMKQNAAINTGPAHGVGGLCECVRCSSSWKAAWAECTCAGAARLATFSFFFFQCYSCLAL